MSVTCTKAMTIRPPFRLTAYWPFDEVYGPGVAPATWTDRVQSIVFSGYEGQSYSGGLLGRAMDWSSPVLATIPEPKLSYSIADNGFTVWFWMKKSTATNPTQILLILSSYTDPVSPSYTLRFRLSPGISQYRLTLSAFADDTDPGTTADIICPPAAMPAWWPATWGNQQWCFCCATFTNSDGTLRLYTSDAAPIVAALPVTMYDMPDANIGVGYTGSGLPILDEFGISLKDVADADIVSALYNSGAGLGWPDVNNL